MTIFNIELYGQIKYLWQMCWFSSKIYLVSVCLKVTLKYHTKMYIWRIMTLGSFLVDSGGTDIGLELHHFWANSSLMPVQQLKLCSGTLFRSIAVPLAVIPQCFHGGFPSSWVLLPLAKTTDFLLSHSRSSPERLRCDPEIGSFSCACSCSHQRGECESCA